MIFDSETEQTVNSELRSMLWFLITVQNVELLYTVGLREYFTGNVDNDYR